MIFKYVLKEDWIQFNAFIEQNQGYLWDSNALKGAQFTVLKAIKNSFPGENMWDH